MSFPLYSFFGQKECGPAGPHKLKTPCKGFEGKTGDRIDLIGIASLCYVSFRTRQITFHRPSRLVYPRNAYLLARGLQEEENGLMNLIIIIFCLVGIPLSITLGIKCLRAYDRCESTVSLIGFLCLTFVVPIILILLLLWQIGSAATGV